MEVKRREGEPTNAFLYRFSKKIQQSGILREAKKRKFRTRPESKLKKKLSALHREKKKKEIAKARKMGRV
ncbi:MAG: 30S ribosomal protein S21 [Spirochaetia bacterium]|nr:MAG: 30S ribosomal protein S21 [Spirochaetia bacterium]